MGSITTYSLALDYKLLKGSEPKGNIVKKRWWDIQLEAYISKLCISKREEKKVGLIWAVLLQP